MQYRKRATGWLFAQFWCCHKILGYVYYFSMDFNMVVKNLFMCFYGKQLEKKCSYAIDVLCNILFWCSFLMKSFWKFWSIFHHLIISPEENFSILDVQEMDSLSVCQYIYLVRKVYRDLWLAVIHIELLHLIHFILFLFWYNNKILQVHAATSYFHKYLFRSICEPMELS